MRQRQAVTHFLSPENPGDRRKTVKRVTSKTCHLETKGSQLSAGGNKYLIEEWTMRVTFFMTPEFDAEVRLVLRWSPISS
jgi:hypothetical protein